MLWRCRDRTFDLSSRVLTMGVLNVTPDSFSDGGRYFDAHAAVARARALAAEGADIIDVGGESSRPGAAPVSVEEELRRVMPVLEAIRPEIDVALSIDTTKAEVARAALDAGADIVNDITALRGDRAVGALVAASGAGLVLMHMQGDPQTMQRDPSYGDVVGEICDFLRERGAACREMGVASEQIVYDPGIGFGKAPEHNLEIFRRMEEFRALGRPLLVGPSRKAFLRRLLAEEGAEPPAADAPETIEATAVAVAAAVLRGASIVRVHDVSAMRRVARIASALR